MPIQGQETEGELSVLSSISSGLEGKRAQLDCELGSYADGIIVAVEGRIIRYRPKNRQDIIINMESDEFYALRVKEEREA